MQGVLHFLLQCSKTFIFGPFGSERNPCPEGWAESVFIDLIFKNLNSSLSTAELEVMDTQTAFFLSCFTIDQNCLYITILSCSELQKSWKNCAGKRNLVFYTAVR